MKLIPLFVVLAIFSIGIRATEVWMESHNINSQALADTPQEDASDDLDGQQLSQAETEEGAAEDLALDTPEATEIPDFLQGLTLFEGDAEFDPEFARSELEILQNLAERRQNLIQREKAVEQKEAILKATEDQIEQKIAELTSIRDELQALLSEQSEEEQARIRSLVKIYEGMKPKDAARILNNLETDILLSVMQQMSERRSSPIIAEMDPERAREITTLLAQQVQLPEDMDAPDQNFLQ